MLGLGLLSGWVTLKFQMKMAISESAKYFWHTLRLPMDFFAQRYASEIGSRVALNDTVATVIATQLTGGALNVLMVAFLCGGDVQVRHRVNFDWNLGWRFVMLRFCVRSRRGGWIRAGSCYRLRGSCWGLR